MSQLMTDRLIDDDLTVTFRVVIPLSIDLGKIWLCEAGTACWILPNCVFLYSLQFSDYVFYFIYNLSTILGFPRLAYRYFSLLNKLYNYRNN